VLDAIRAVADEEGATPAQVALRWLMDYPDATVVPIVGARTVEQLDENVGATDVTLSDAQWDRIFEARYDEEGRRFGHRE
jgi:aryl-alcohol dehydrogenase-like predicted oxidoreductase